MSLQITIQTIPHKSQRYDTCGDWLLLDHDHILITVSDLGNWKEEALVAVHEAIEALLCKDREISEDIVNKFDLDFEANRPTGNVDEPGDAQGAPYRKEHFFATTIERLLARELNVDWTKYEEKINSL